MSDYLASLAARSIHQNQGVRFLVGELRPRLASRFEPPFTGAAAWPESPLSVEEVADHESIAPEVPYAPAQTHFYHPDGERRPVADDHPASSIDFSAAEQKPELPTDEMPSPIVRVIEGIRPEPGEQSQPVRQATRYREENEALPSTDLSPPSMSSQSQPVSATKPTSPSGLLPRQRRSSAVKTAQKLRETPPAVPETMIQETIIERVSDRVRLLRVEPQGLSERSDGVPHVLDQSVEPPQVDQRGVTQWPIREDPVSSSVQRPSVTKAVTQIENAPLNGRVSSSMPTPGQSPGVLQSVLARLGEPRHDAEPNPAPTVNVTIGRVEVRATPAAPASTPKPRSAPVMTLEEYLQRRATGGGS
jgi:hypothetical protein